MQVHRDLTIVGEPEQLKAVGEDIRRSLAEGWTRDADAEDHMTMFPSGTKRLVYCFAAPKRPRRPAATVFLLNRDDGTLQVANVVPSEQHELSRDEYNAIIEDFYKRFVRPAAERHGVQAELTDAKADLEHWLPESAAEKLRLFCARANKRTGSNHPMDRERWYDFIVAAHEADFTSATLVRWLQEEGGWDEEMADRLAAEYEFARGLLAFSNGERVGG